MTSQAAGSNFRERVLAGRSRNRRLNPADELFGRGVFEYQGQPTFGIVPIPGTARAKTHPLIWLTALVLLLTPIGYGIFVYTSLPG